jgi:hypothetical protein
MDSNHRRGKTEPQEEVTSRKFGRKGRRKERRNTDRLLGTSSLKEGAM